MNDSFPYRSTNQNIRKKADIVNAFDGKPWTGKIVLVSGFPCKILALLKLLSVSIVLILMSSSVEAAEGCWSGQGSLLKVLDVPYHVSIKVQENPIISVCAYPVKTLQSHFMIHKQKQDVVVQGRGEIASTKHGQNSTVFRGEVRQWIIGPNAVGEVTIGGITERHVGQQESPPRLTIKIPEGTHIILSGVCNEVVAGSTKGDLELDVTGACDAHFGDVGGATLRMSGASNVQISSVSKNLLVFSQGMADIQVESGYVENLEVDILGSGDFRFNGTARRAKLRSVGVGDMWIKTIQEKPEVELLGVGDVIYNQ
jgi:hypothetical protein